MCLIEIYGWIFLVVVLLFSLLLLLVFWSSDVGVSLGMSWDILGVVIFVVLLFSVIFVVNM